MNWKLTLTRRALASLSAGIRANPARVRVSPAGLSRLQGSTEFLLHSVDSSPRADHQASANAVVLGASSEAEFASRLRSALARPVADPPTAFLALGTGSVSGRVAGFVSPSPGLAEPLSTIAVAAEGFPRLDLSLDARPLAATEATMWSRTIGALGETVWRRLTDLRYCLIGCGRTGSLVAASLRRFGAKHLTLIDPDRWELHNLGESDVVGAGAIGQSKAASLAGSFLSLREDSAVNVVKESALALPSLIAAKESDVLICAADNPTAHLATAVLAKLYLKVLLDIGTGVLAAPGGGRRVGADVRLVIPDRCLMCFGGIAGFDQARRELLTSQTSLPWPSQRAGSLRSLNMIATGHALRLLEEMAVGRLRESTWVNLEFQGDGLPVLSNTQPELRGGCPACGFTGYGDGGITELAEMLRSV